MRVSLSVQCVRPPIGPNVLDIIYYLWISQKHYVYRKFKTRLRLEF